MCAQEKLWLHIDGAYGAIGKLDPEVAPLFAGLSRAQSVAIDPHKRTLTATVADPRSGIVGSEHFRVSGEGHRALEAWARQYGQIARWGVENAAEWAGTRRCSWPAAAVTCASCAPTARPA